MQPPLACCFCDWGPLSHPATLLFVAPGPAAAAQCLPVPSNTEVTVSSHALGLSSHAVGLSSHALGLSLSALSHLCSTAAAAADCLTQNPSHPQLFSQCFCWPPPNVGNCIWALQLPPQHTVVPCAILPTSAAWHELPYLVQLLCRLCVSDVISPLIFCCCNSCWV